MPEDLRDYQQDVDRTSPRLSPDLYWWTAGADFVAAANTTSRYLFDTVDDGYHVVVDTILCDLWTVGVFYSCVDFWPDQTINDYYDISEGFGEFTVRHAMSQRKALSLYYPNRVSVDIFNPRFVAANASIAIAYYRYKLGD